jgi:hypothetical protein
MQSNQSEMYLLNSVTVLLLIFLLSDGATTFLGIYDAIQVENWMQWLFAAFVSLSAMFYVVCLRWLNKQSFGLKGYRSFVINLTIPCLFLLFFTVDGWSTFESIKKYFVKGIDFQQNLLALLILIAGTLVCVSTPILIAFYDDIKKTLL